jgi:ABC-type multidrug transport system ATPase subunit
LYFIADATNSKLYPGFILRYGVFAKTNVGLLVLFNILSGLSLSSFSIFGAAFFHKAQLSGIVTTIVALLLAVLAQVLQNANTGAVAILSLLFPPMNYTFFTILMARWERQNMPTNLIKAAPQNPSTLPGIAMFVFTILHIILFPILGAFIERALYGTASKGRQLSSGVKGSDAAVQLTGFTKRYKPSWWARNVATKFGKRKETVVAVDDLNLTIPQGQIMVLLGANGSGKSTTLDAIAGLNTVTSGTVAVDGFGGLGICPQRNVLWDVLTAFEHVRIFNRLKSTGKISSKAEIEELIAACDLDRKIGAQARYLSGGQKRKLQLSMMFTGGSRVCCVDECSSGVDALARKKLWDILMNERGKRTIIFTTHFLDEADLLSDQIAILSRGSLKAQGSAVELKHRLGGGYRIHVFKTPGDDRIIPYFEGMATKEQFDRTIFTVPNSAQAADLIRSLDSLGIKNYEISSPTIEEIFFNVAEDLEAMSAPPANGHDTPRSPPSPTGKLGGELMVAEDKKDSLKDSDNALKLQTGKRIGILRQALTLFRKRWTVFQRNYIPYVAAFLIPVVAAGLVTLFLKGFTATGCSPTAAFTPSQIQSLLSQAQYDLVIGPASKISPEALARLEATLPGGNATGSSGSGLSDLMSSVHTVDGTLEDFNNYINHFYANVTPGGFFLGDNASPPTFAWKGNGADISLATITQNALDTLLLNVSISSQYQAFDSPWVPGIGKTLQLIVYFGLAMCAYPAFFALYPTLERLRNVRQLHYSNGVRSISLWSAYLVSQRSRLSVSYMSYSVLISANRPSTS